MSSFQKITANDWQPMVIDAGRYFNPEAQVGYELKEGKKGNPLFGDSTTAFENELKQQFAILKQQRPELSLKRIHVAMPKVNPQQLPNRFDYQIIEQPEPLTSTSISIIKVNQNLVASSKVRYHFNQDQLVNLNQRLFDEPQYHGLISNLGYFMTKELNCGNHPWSHANRYQNPDFQLPESLSYLGFYAINDDTGLRSGFPSAHHSAVAIDKKGNTSIIANLQVDRFKLTINKTSFDIQEINPDFSQLKEIDIALFDSNLHVEHSGESIDFAPILPLNNRVNLFIANQGDGDTPQEQVVKIWHGECPLPSFGVILSITKEHYQTLFDTDLKIGTHVDVTPFSSTIDFEQYSHIYGGLVPSVINGQPIVVTGENHSAKDAEASLHQIANINSPIAKTAKETNNFDPEIREPAGLLFQTEKSIGYLLFDGRHQMSIGANIVDVSNLVSLLQNERNDLLDGEKIINAIVVDGGSAMKSYVVDTIDINNPSMTLLNRVAAGSRNAAGSDHQGLNLYSTLTLCFI
ncbi:hypothetical protein L0B53_13215 [Vibrio sp. SS-MA-C1-2]|uniref:hypothetical protein n=1 Tax=Vibrio sp. SS-MA-C1-2 TaxID=2908646 RepID=UPI001F163F23|nr:hypothetical protein [Vibrio sp. SS-MA-C1-2]UJF17981.1 hypothetical protein L0B53_13215 [Vibrio sp. SS-MA-C1-2]